MQNILDKLEAIGAQDIRDVEEGTGSGEKLLKIMLQLPLIDVMKFSVASEFIRETVTDDSAYWSLRIEKDFPFANEENVGEDVRKKIGDLSYIDYKLWYFKLLNALKTLDKYTIEYEPNMMSHQVNLAKMKLPIKVKHKGGHILFPVMLDPDYPDFRTYKNGKEFSVQKIPKGKTKEIFHEMVKPYIDEGYIIFHYGFIPKDFRELVDAGILEVL